MASAASSSSSAARWTPNRVQFESLARKNAVALVLGFRYHDANHPTLPIGLVVDLQSWDQSWSDAGIDYLVPAKILQDSNVKERSFLLKVLNFVKEKSHKRKGRLFAVLATGDDVIGLNRVLIINIDKLLPELKSLCLKRVVVFRDLLVFHKNEVCNIIASINPVEWMMRWQEAVTLPTSEFYGLDTKKRFVVEIYTPKHKDEIVQLCAKEKFYVEEISGLCDAGYTTREKMGLILRQHNIDETPGGILGFAFLTVSEFRPINRKLTAQVHLHYVLVASSARGMNIGSTLLDYAVTEAEAQFPGAQILVSVESKNSTGALKFWFIAQGFIRECKEDDEGPQPGSKVYAPNELLAELGKLQEESHIQVPGTDFMDFL